MHLSPRVNKQASAHFELVHYDIWGPCLVLSPTGFNYFVTFVDDFSCVTWLYLMKSRYEFFFFSHFSAFCAKIQTQFHVSVQTLRRDNANEYLSEHFQSFMLHGILHQTSCVDTPSQNGVIGRKNRHLLETARALLFQMDIPKHFLTDAVFIACFFINRAPSSVLNWATPYHQLFPNSPLFPIDPNVFGCTCFVRDVRLQVSKLNLKSLKCIFIGYSRVQKRYKCYCSTLCRYFVSTDITFFETTLIFPSVYYYKLGGGRRLASSYSCLTHCLSQTCSYLCLGKTSYHSSLYSTPTPPSLEPSTSCFNVKSSSQ